MASQQGRSLHAHTHADRGKQLPSRRPVQWIVGIVRWSRDKDDISVTLAQMAGRQGVFQVNQGDRSGDGLCVHVRRHGGVQSPRSLSELTECKLKLIPVRVGIAVKGPGARLYESRRLREG